MKKSNTKKPKNKYQAQKNKVTNASINKKWLSVYEAAAYLCVSSVTIYRWKAQKKIPFFKLGHKLKFDMTALDKWVSSNTSWSK